MGVHSPFGAFVDFEFGDDVTITGTPTDWVWSWGGVFVGINHAGTNVAEIELDTEPLPDSTVTIPPDSTGVLTVNGVPICAGTYPIQID